jgi:hypothetical protein
MTQHVAGSKPRIVDRNSAILNQIFQVLVPEPLAAVTLAQQIVALVRHHGDLAH